MMRPTAREPRIFTFCLSFILLGLFPFLLPGCRAGGPRQLESLRIGLPALEQNALVYVAEERGYFLEEGLDVSIEHYDSGVTSLQALFEKKVELAVAAEFPVVRALLDQAPVAVVAGIDQFENDFIVARKDRGIREIADLRGKRIGVTLGSINEFFLTRFLQLNGLRPEDITQVNLKPAEFVGAIASGDVDALIAWQPYIQQIEQEVPGVVIWPAQNNQLVYGLLTARPDWLADHPEMAVRFLAALRKAETDLVREPQAAQAVVQKKLNYSPEYVADIWDDHTFMLSLDNSLIVAMNDEARWLIRSGLSTAKQKPEFYEAMYLDGLKAVQPEAVTIER